MDKPTKPTDLMPRQFGGVKNNFSASLQNSGYEDGVPAIYGGDNLNYQLDSTGKELDYCEKIVDFINNIPIGKTITVDANNKLVYSDYTNGADVDLSNLSQIGEAKLDTKVSKSGDTMTGALTFTATGDGTVNFDVPEQTRTSILFKDTGSGYPNIGEIVCINNSYTRPSDQYQSADTELRIQDGLGYVSLHNGYLSFSNTNCVDGQWVNSFHALTTVVDIGNYAIDLSSYLPNDNYSYEVMVCFKGFRGGGTTNSIVSVSDTSVTLTGGNDIINNAVYGITEFDGDHKEAGEFNCIVVVGSSRKFYFNIARFKLGDSALIMTKYRRIGTNS